ncbi:hypothetical protein TRVA0_031S01332 [Trichomonascus vanleenenianus]|uniref:uncharacterized protein n=1 Tax=Trichomonascus vanleenenianus TaxID=2268995 RepID=UPI003ECB97F8
MTTTIIHPAVSATASITTSSGCTSGTISPSASSSVVSSELPMATLYQTPSVSGKSTPATPRRNFELPVPLDLFRAAQGPAEPSYLKSDLKSIRKWTDFEPWVTSILETLDEDLWQHEFKNVIPPDYSVPISGEMDVHEVLSELVFSVTSTVLDLPGVKLADEYRFGEDSKTSRASVGDFDFYFTKNNTPLFIVEVESPWDWPELGNDSQVFRHVVSRSEVTRRYFERMYAYMVFNNTEFGVVTTYQHTRFVRVVGNELLVSGVYSFDQQESHTTIGALVAMALYCSGYKSLSPSLRMRSRFLPVAPKSREFRGGQICFGTDYEQMGSLLKRRDNVLITMGQYRRTPKQQDERLAFDKPEKPEESDDPYTSGSEPSDGEREPLNAIIKCQDISKNSDDSSLQWEGELYSRLQEIQGVVIPQCLCYGTVWGALSVLAISREGRNMTLEDVGRPGIANKIMTALTRLHSFDIVHGDIRPQNFLINDDDDEVRIIGLSKCFFTGSPMHKREDIDQAREMIQKGARYAWYKSHTGVELKLIQNHWREYKSRCANSGWRRYSHKFARARISNDWGVFTVAIKLHTNTPPELLS